MRRRHFSEKNWIYIFKSIKRRQKTYTKAFKSCKQMKNKLFEKDTRIIVEMWSSMRATRSHISRYVRRCSVQKDSGILWPLKRRRFSLKRWKRLANPYALTIINKSMKFQTKVLTIVTHLTANARHKLYGKASKIIARWERKNASARLPS